MDIFDKVNSLIFIHCPKTAGTSLTSFIIKNLNLKDEEIYNCGQRARTHIEGNIKFMNLPLEEKKKFRFICGHVELFILQTINYPVFTFTLLRDPIKRIISLYNFIIQTKTHHLHDFIIKNRLSISDFIKSGAWIETNNGMVRRLCGGIRIPYGRCNFRMLENAIFNLRKLSLFGFQEKFEEFIKILSMVLGISCLSFEYINVTNYKIEVDEKDIKTIEAFNQLDIELYKYAKTIYVDKFRSFLERCQ